MQHKVIRVLMVVVLLAMFSSLAAAQDKAVVTWGFWGSPEEAATHTSVAEAFMEANPDIEIEIWHQPWSDYFTSLDTLWAAGDGALIPDVLFLSPPIRYAARGVLEELTPYIEAHDYDISDFWPGLLEYGTTYDEDGTRRIWGFPRDIGLEVLYYNKEIFDEVGVAYPTDEWTWDDLLAAAEQLTVVESTGRVSRYALGMEGGKFALFVLQNNGGLLDDMRNPTQCILDSPESIEAVEFFAGMMDNNYAMRSANLGQAGGDAAVFQSGQVAMIIQNASRVSAFNAAGMNYDVAPVPIPADGQRAAAAGGAAWTMSALSDDKESAWTFLSWLQSTDGGQGIYTASGEILPALESTALSEAFLGSEENPADPPDNRMAFIIEGRNAKPGGRVAYFPEWGEINGNYVRPVMNEIWAGEAVPAEVLPGVCDDVDAYLAEMNAG